MSGHHASIEVTRLEAQVGADVIAHVRRHRYPRTLAAPQVRALAALFRKLDDAARAIASRRGEDVEPRAPTFDPADLKARADDWARDLRTIANGIERLADDDR